MGDIVATVFIDDIVEDFVAAIVGEVDIDIGHADAFGVEEAFEEEAVGDWVEVGDVEGPSDNCAGGGTATRADDDFLVFGVFDEVVDNQEVGVESHLVDGLEFVVKAGLIFGWNCGAFEAVAETLFAKFAEVFFGGFVVGGLKCGDEVLVELKVDIAHFGDFQSVFDHFGGVFVIFFDFVDGAKGKVAFVAHAVFLVDGGAGLDTEEDIVDFFVFGARIMGVEGEDEAEVVLFGEFF